MLKYWKTIKLNIGFMNQVASHPCVSQNGPAFYVFGCNEHPVTTSTFFAPKSVTAMLKILVAINIFRCIVTYIASVKTFLK